MDELEDTTDDQQSGSSEDSSDSDDVGNPIPSNLDLTDMND